MPVFKMVGSGGVKWRRGEGVARAGERENSDVAPRLGGVAMDCDEIDRSNCYKPIKSNV